MIFFNLFIFYWRIIALQNFVVFCQTSTWISHRYTYILEKAMATDSNILAWKIPWTEEPSRLQSTASWRVGHDWVISLSLFTFMHWRRKWQPIPVFLLGESQGRGSLVGCRLWGHTESDMTEVTWQQAAAYIYPLPFEPPSHLPPHPTPLGWYSPCLSFLSHTANFHWLSILYMIM